MALQIFKIASTTVGSAGASSIDFTSIPSGYTDLKVVMSVRKIDATTLSSSYLKFNSSSTGYSYKRIYGNGSGAYSDTNVTGTASMYLGSSNSATSTANTFSSVEIYIPNYNSANNKSLSVEMVQEDNATAGYQFAIAGLWSNTAAITSIAITGDANYVQYTTATLYGIK